MTRFAPPKQGTRPAGLFEPQAPGAAHQPPPRRQSGTTSGQKVTKGVSSWHGRLARVESRRMQADVDADFRTQRFVSSWREEALARICELRALIASFQRQGLPGESMELLVKAGVELEHADHAARRRRIIRGGVLTGAAVQRVHGHLDAAEVLVLQAAPPDYVRGQIPALVAYIRRHLVPSDPRCQSAEQVLRTERTAAARPVPPPRPRQARRSEAQQVSPDNRNRLVAALHGAMAEARNEQMRVRSFRNILLVFAVLLVGLAIGVCVLGAVAPKRLPVCFQPVQIASGQAEPRRLVCPTGESALP